MYYVEGKISIVTGGAQGIGKGIVKRLLQAGCRVCLSDIDDSKGIEAKNEFQKEFGYGDDKVCFFKADVISKEDWAMLWDFTEITLGGKVEILINNAGLTPFVRSALKSSLSIHLHI